MPEQLTKHPDETLAILKSAGAKCGEGVPKKTLTQCPTERFCALPGGEICVYGLAQAPQMTQTTAKELAQAALPGQTPPGEISAMETIAVVSVLIAGIFLGRFWPRVRQK